MAAGTGLLRKVEVTPVVDTGAYADGDVLFDVTEIPNVLRVERDGTQGANIALNSIELYDESDNTALEVDFVFFRTAIAGFGAANDAFAGITDAELLEVIGVVTVDSAVDVSLDLINNMYHAKYGLAQQMQGVVAETSLFVAAINRTNTPTFTAITSLKVRFGFTQD